MRPADGVDLLLLEDAGVLFHAPRQEIFALDASATVIWCLMLEYGEPAAMAEALAGRATLPLARASAFVAQATDDWRARGLLDGTTGPRSDAQEEVRPRWPMHPDTRFAGEAYYRFRGRAITLRFSETAQGDVVRPLLAHLAVERSPNAPDITLDIVSMAGRIVLFQDGVARAACGGVGELAPIVKSLVWQAGLDAGGYLLNIHAGVVEGAGGCILLAAPPGHGKSTLTAALIRAGLGYFSDEVALLAAEDFTVSPFPLAICVKDTGIGIMATLLPTSGALPFHARGDGKRVAYIPPPRSALRPEGTSRAVVAIVFPRHVAGGPPHWAEVAKPAALARLLGQCLGVGPRLDLTTVRRLLAWLATVRCIEITYDDLATIVPKLLVLAAGQGAGRDQGRCPVRSA